VPERFWAERLRHEGINYAKSATSSAEIKQKGITNVFARASYADYIIYA